jgi:hypothetical protein
MLALSMHCFRGHKTRFWFTEPRGMTGLGFLLRLAGQGSTWNGANFWIWYAFGHTSDLRKHAHWRKMLSGR